MAEPDDFDPSRFLSGGGERPARPICRSAAGGGSASGRASR
ncbi:hypothetical protein I552_5643 [Mycobacterium xenopi 3993]|nr:hypothetical protein I552_5643 [Mycobacterium xenopi 3993]